MPVRNRLSILSNASKADLRLDPFPHLIIENALDPEVFAELAASFPDDDLVVDGRTVKDTWFDYPACKVVKDQRLSPMWRDFSATTPRPRSLPNWWTWLATRFASFTPTWKAGSAAR